MCNISVEVELMLKHRQRQLFFLYVCLMQRFWKAQQLYNRIFFFFSKRLSKALRCLRIQPREGKNLCKEADILINAPMLL